MLKLKLKAKQYLRVPSFDEEKKLISNFYIEVVFYIEVIYITVRVFLAAETFLDGDSILFTFCMATEGLVEVAVDSKLKEVLQKP